MYFVSETPWRLSLDICSLPSLDYLYIIFARRFEFPLVNGRVKCDASLLNLPEYYLSMAVPATYLSWWNYSLPLVYYSPDFVVYFQLKHQQFMKNFIKNTTKGKLTSEEVALIVMYDME